MRLIAFVTALFLVGSPAAAKDWMEYTYPDHSFTVAFPAEPRIEPTTYQAADGRAFAARTYSVALDGGLFKMTVVDLPDTNANGDALVSHAVKTLTDGSQIKLDIPHRIRSTYGRQLAFARPDGSFTYCADCKVATPSSCSAANPSACACSGGGTGAFAKRTNGAWLCN